MSPEEYQAALDALKGKLDEEGQMELMRLLEAMKAPVEAPEPEAKSDEEPAPEAEQKADDESAPEPEAKAEEPAPEAEAKADDEDEEKKPEDLGKAQSEELAKAVERADAAEAELAKMRDAEELREYVSKAAKKMVALPGVKPAELGVMLRQIHKSLGADAYGSLCMMLESASEAIGKSTLMKSVGSDRSDATGGAMTRLEAEISNLRKKSPELTREQALYKVARTQPGIFRAAAEE